MVPQYSTVLVRPWLWYYYTYDVVQTVYDLELVQH